MPIDPCCDGHADDVPRPLPHTALTRRRMLLAGAAGAGALALKGIPAGAETSGFGQPGGDPSGPTTTTAPPTTTTTPPPVDDPFAGSSEGALDGPMPKDYGFLPPRPASERHVRPMMFPIVGPVSWSDTYLAPRGGGRRHEGQDLMAGKMQKLLACVSGVVIELRHGSSGNSLYLQGDDGWYYCYLHINNDTPGTDDGANRYDQAFGPGITQGTRVKKGQHLAYVGDSGNAEGSGSHCHFEIRMPNARWYNAAAVNAVYSLTAAEAPNEGPQVPPDTFYPWTNANDLIKRQYSDLLGRSASAANLTYWGKILNQGQQTPAQMMDFFLHSPESDDKTHSVARLYQAFFLRRPDISGFSYWTGRRRDGYPLTSIADAFARSSEFTSRYGTLSNSSFVDRIYRNVLGRAADAEGKSFWTSKLDGGRSRGTVMVQFSDSAENRFAQNWPMQVIVAHGCMMRRMPSADEVTLWTELFRTGRNSVRDMLAIIQRSDEYRWITATTT